MCMEDIRLGRQATGEMQTVSVGTSYADFISPDPDRICLAIYPVATNTIFVSTNGDQAASTGIRINDSTGPLIMNLITHGAIIRKGWRAMTSGAMADSVTYSAASLGKQ